MADGLSANFNRATVRLVRAGDDFNERGFARAIFTE
jgi:hypothetical protein